MLVFEMLVFGIILMERKILALVEIKKRIANVSFKKITEPSLQGWYINIMVIREES